MWCRNPLDNGSGRLCQVDLLAQEFSTITYQDVVTFCRQKVVESTELDYKMAIPRDLAKHVAAMSNRYGGLIIIGVEEDPATGTPGKYEGMANNGKLIERIHQVANNVRPLPGYAVRTTDEVAGKVFLLVRIYEGDAPPYTTVNDPTVYLRSGNTTIVLRQADVDLVRELHAKRDRAQSVREQNLSRASDVLKATVKQKDDAQLKSFEDSTSHGLRPERPQLLSEGLHLLTSYLQPFFPQRELALPRIMLEQLRSVHLASSQARMFPSLNMRPITRGMMSFDWPVRGYSFSSDQIYANGLFFHSENPVGPQLERAGEIFLWDIARVFYCTLMFGRRFYSNLGYSGLVRGGVSLEGAQGRSVRSIPREGYYYFPSDAPVTLNDTYNWPIEADTHQLNDPDWAKLYIYEQMHEIYWDLGIRELPENVLDSIIAEWEPH